MDKWLIVLSVLCVLAAVVFSVYSYQKSRRQTQRIKKMIDAAIEGKFRESRFDETVLSQLENRFAEYLESHEVTQGKLSEERDKIKELISDISHQTKTPIANLLLYGELLQEMDVPEEAAEYTAQILRQAGKLQVLIDDLVKLSRLETGILKMQPERESVQDMLKDILENYAPAAEARGLKLRVLMPDTRAEENTSQDMHTDVGESVSQNMHIDAKESVSQNMRTGAGESASQNLYKNTEANFDRKWTQEAISNIVDNAIKYTEHGGIDIAVREFELFVAIDIHDTGIGVPEEEQAEIFGRFYRGKNVRGQDGVGIGLYLAREIISGQGGYIKLSSDGRGSTFSVFLPKVQP